MNGMSSLYIGIDGLNAAQTALNTTTHNLANTYTEGYTRQVAFNATRRYNHIGYTPGGKVQVGTGVYPSETSRVRDVLLDLRCRKETSRQGFYEAQYEVVSDLETYFGEMEGVQFQNELTSFREAMSEVAKIPGNMEYRSTLLMSAEVFLDRAKNIYQETVSYQKSLNDNVSNMVDKINSYGEQIYEINKKIVALSSGVEQPNDLRDQRDHLLDQLSEYVKISYFEDSDGYMTVNVEGASFVTDDGVFPMDIEVKYEENGADYPVCVWPYMDNKEVFYLNEQIDTANQNDYGKLKGTLLARGEFRGDYRDLEKTKPENYDLETEEGRKAYTEALEYYDKHVNNSEIVKTQVLFDNLIHTIVTTINDIMSPVTDTVPVGVTSYTDAEGNTYDATQVKILDMNTSTGNDGKMPPRELFVRDNTPRFIEVTGNDGNTYYMLNDKNQSGFRSDYTITNISVNPELQKDYSLLPFRTLEGEEDMEKCNQLMEAWDRRFTNLDPNHTSSLDFMSYYNEIVYGMGNDGNLYQSIVENQTEALSEIKTVRSQIIGVSTSEELANMIQFQSAYNASSRYITVLSQMLEHLVTQLGA